MTEKEDRLNWLEHCGFGPKIMLRTKVCPHCRAMLNAKHFACPNCGFRLLSKTLYQRYREKHLCCDKCGTVIASDSRYCPYCGRHFYLKVDNKI